MSVVAIGAVRSCGATTLALSLAATWPTGQRVLLVEADPAGGTLAASLGWAPEPGLVSLAAAVRRAEGTEQVLAHAQVLPGGARVLPAPAVGDQARYVLDMLDGLLGRLDELDADVLLDCGRLEHTPQNPEPKHEDFATLRSTACSNTARFASASCALLVARPSLADLHAVSSFLSDPALDPALAAGRLRLVLVGDGPYPDAEVEVALGIEVASRLPFDPKSAEALTSLPATARELRRAPLVRAARTLATSLAGPLPDDRRLGMPEDSDLGARGGAFEHLRVGAANGAGEGAQQ